MNTSEGLRQAGVYSAKIVILFVAVLALATAALYRLQCGLGTELPSGTYSDMAVYSLRYVIPLLPLVALSFLAGSCPAGSLGRLLTRVVMNIVLASMIVFMAGNFSYSIEGLCLDEELGVTSPYASMEVRIPGISMILLAIPALSLADAVLEFVQHRKATETGP